MLLIGQLTIVLLHRPSERRLQSACEVAVMNDDIMRSQADDVTRHHAAVRIIRRSEKKKRLGCDRVSSLFAGAFQRQSHITLLPRVNECF